MKFSRTRRAEVEVNLTPLIDVVFLLLIFFMVSTTFTKETHLSIDLPEAVGEPVATNQQTIELIVTRSGDYAINQVPLVNNKLETLKRAIEKVGGGDTSIPFTITADSETSHQAVVTAMDAAGQLGFTALSITTRNAGEPTN